MKSGSKLSLQLQNKLHIDIEANPSASCHDIISLNPNIYPDNLVVSIRNRYNYLKRLKRSNPSRYWKIYACVQASVDITEDTNETTVKAMADSDDAYPDEQQSRHPTWAPPKKQTHGKVQAEPSTEKGTQPLKRNTTKQNDASPFSSPLKEDMSMTFSSLEEAVNMVDDVIYVDFSFPEANSNGLFIQRLDQIRSPSGNELISLCKVMLYHIVDLRDFQKHSGLLVCGGAALLVEVPSVPFFLLEESLNLLNAEKNRCDRTEDLTAAAMNKIKRDPTRQTRSILLVFPEGVTCSADFSDNAPTTDKKVKLALRNVESAFVLGKKQAPCTQRCYPGCWQLRILKKEADVLKFDDEDNECDVLDAFQGMNI